MKQEEMQMATEAQLRRRISELQSQIENLRFQNETFQNNIAQQMNERFARMKAEYESALIRQKMKQRNYIRQEFALFRNSLSGICNSITRNWKKKLNIL